MKPFNEYKDDEVMDLYAELLDAGETLFEDEEIRKFFEKDSLTGKEKVSLIRKLIKEHKNTVVHLMAVFDGKKDSEYHYGIFDLPMTLMGILTDKEVLSFLSSLRSLKTITDSLNVFGSATTNTEETVNIS